MDRVTLQAGDYVCVDGYDDAEQATIGRCIRNASGEQCAYFFIGAAECRGWGKEMIRELSTHQVLNATNAHPPAPVIDVGSGEWNGEGLPPVGTECEVLNNSFAHPDWESCVILFSGKFKTVYDSESCTERVCDNSMLKFRTIQIERDKVIEAASKLIPTSSESVYKAMKIKLGTLYDAGMLKLPED